MFPITLGFVSDVSFFVPYVILASVVVLSIIVQETFYRLREKGVRRTYLEVPFITLSSEVGELHADPKELSNAELATAIQRMLKERDAIEGDTPDSRHVHDTEAGGSGSTVEGEDSVKTEGSQS